MILQVGKIQKVDVESFDIKVKNLDLSLEKKVEEFDEEKNQTLEDLTKANEKIKSKHVRYKQTITKDAETYKQNLNKKYSKYYQKAINLQNTFHSAAALFLYSQYVAVGILLLCLIFILTNLPSILDIYTNPIINGAIPFALIIVLIIFLIFTRETYRKVRSINPEHVESLTKELNDIQLSSVEPYNIQDEITVQKRCMDQLVSSTQSAVDVIISKIPLYKEYIEDDYFRRKWELGCDEYQNALTFFGLQYGAQFQQLKDRPNLLVKRADDSLIDHTILEDSSKSLHMPVEIIEIYIKYYRGENTRLQWDKIKKDANMIKRVAKDLFDSNQLDIDKSMLTENEILQIVQNTTEFSIGQLSKNSSLYVQVRLKVENYVKILLENSISVIWNRDLLIPLINFKFSFEENFLKIFSDILNPILPVSNTRAYSRAVIAILLNDELLFKEKVCQNAAEDETVFILMTYHELLNERRENNQIFKLSDLLDNIDALDSTKLRIQTDLELKKRFDYFKNDLSRGLWWDDGLSLQRQMFDDLKQDFNEKIRTLNQSITITKFIEKTFTEININIVDKAIDANLFSTYLILTTSSKGRLLEYLDSISIRKADLTKKDFSELKKCEGTYGITLMRDGNPKYDYAKYSNRTRIGVLPRNTNFLDFVQEIKEDIKTILQAVSQEPEGEMEDIGLAFIRINPSKYSFGLLDDEIEKYCNIRTRDLHIAKIITVLARDYTLDSEQYLLSAFDGKINLTEIFNQMSILELIQASDREISEEYSRFLKSDDLKKAILASLAKEEIFSIKGLSKNVRSSKENHEKLEKIIRISIADEYRLRNRGMAIQTTRLNTLVSDLMKTLDSIADLMEKLS